MCTSKLQRKINNKQTTQHDSLLFLEFLNCTCYWPTMEQRKKAGGPLYDEEALLRSYHDDDQNWESLLKDQPVGTFLLRASSKGKNFIAVSFVVGSKRAPNVLSNTAVSIKQLSTVEAIPSLTNPPSCVHPYLSSSSLTANALKFLLRRHRLPRLLTPPPQTQFNLFYDSSFLVIDQKQIKMGA